MVTAQTLNIAHTEILAPGSLPTVAADTQIAAQIIHQASRLVATINRCRLALAGIPTPPP